MRLPERGKIFKRVNEKKKFKKQVTSSRLRNFLVVLEKGTKIKCCSNALSK